MPRKIPTQSLADLADTPRPVRIGSDLAPDDQATALARMAPPGLAAGQPARAWLAGHVFVVTRAGRLDRHQRSPVAKLEESA